MLGEGATEIPSVTPLRPILPGLDFSSFSDSLLRPHQVGILDHRKLVSTKTRLKFEPTTFLASASRVPLTISTLNAKTALTKNARYHTDHHYALTSQSIWRQTVNCLLHTVQVNLPIWILNNLIFKTYSWQTTTTTSNL